MTQSEPEIFEAYNTWSEKSGRHLKFDAFKAGWEAARQPSSEPPSADLEEAKKQIVAWLRSLPTAGYPHYIPRLLADAIERGDYKKPL